MKNYLYKFEFFSSMYEDVFFKQISAESDKDALIQIVASFIDAEEELAEELLRKEIGEEDWRAEDFWDASDCKFTNGTEAYTLINLKEIDFDLNDIEEK